MDKKEYFSQIYDALVTHCGARNESYERFSFVHRFTEDARPPSEWRFQGKLGFGGKFRYPGLTVDCYPEDETPQRMAMIQQTNVVLEQIRLEHQEVLAKEAA